MISLRLVDTRNDALIDMHPRLFKHVDTAYNALRKDPRTRSWRRGGLGIDNSAGPEWHIHAVACAADGSIVARWAFIPVLTFTEVRHPDGTTIHRELHSARMTWVRLGDDLAAQLTAWPGDPPARAEVHS